MLVRMPIAEAKPARVKETRRTIWLPKSALALRFLTDPEATRYCFGGIRVARHEDRTCSATATDGRVLVRLTFTDPLTHCDDYNVPPWSLIIPAFAFAQAAKFAPSEDVLVELEHTERVAAFKLETGRLLVTGIEGRYPHVEDVFAASPGGQTGVPRVNLSPVHLSRLLRVFRAYCSQDDGVRFHLPDEPGQGMRLVSRDNKLEAVLMPMVEDD